MKKFVVVAILAAFAAAIVVILLRRPSKRSDVISASEAPKQTVTRNVRPIDGVYRAYVATPNTPLEFIALFLNRDGTASTTAPAANRNPLPGSCRYEVEDEAVFLLLNGTRTFGFSRVGEDRLNGNSNLSGLNFVRWIDGDKKLQRLHEEAMIRRNLETMVACARETQMRILLDGGEPDPILGSNGIGSFPFVMQLKAVAGENYGLVAIGRNSGKTSVQTLDGRVIEVTY